MIAGLDNPFWTALTTRQHAVAIGTAAARRYPADMAPFFGVAAADADVAATLATCVAPGETLDALGIVPRLAAGWRITAFRPLAQMLRETPMGEVPGPPIRELSVADRAAALALAARVYPHYFRPRTMALGRYFGLFDGDRLVAMLGERVQLDAATEISAICTHPDYVGRGFARCLIAHLVNDLLRRGRLPFLHVAYDNLRAKALYDRLGFRLRADLGFWAVTRLTAP